MEITITFNCDVTLLETMNHLKSLNSLLVFVSLSSLLSSSMRLWLQFVNVDTFPSNRIPFEVNIPINPNGIIKQTRQVERSQKNCVTSSKSNIDRSGFSLSVSVYIHSYFRVSFICLQLHKHDNYHSAMD